MYDPIKNKMAPVFAMGPAGALNILFFSQIPSSPEEVEGKTSRWLKSFSERPKGERQPGWVRVLDGVGDGDVVTSGLSTPEEVRTN